MSVSPPVDFLAPLPYSLRRPFHHKNSVDVFVRHTKDCPHSSSGRDFRKCRCPKYLYVYKDGAASHVSAKTSCFGKTALWRAFRKGLQIDLRCPDAERFEGNTQLSCLESHLYRDGAQISSLLPIILPRLLGECLGCFISCLLRHPAATPVAAPL